jgi:hypothetical protein
MEFYVYVLLNPLKSGDFKYGNYQFDYEPFYVGKGKGKRKTNTLSEKKNLFKKRVIEKIKIFGYKPIRILVRENLSEYESFQLEKELIKLIGRIDIKTGCLCNFTDGGEGSSGIIQSEETKKKRKNSLSQFRSYFKTEAFSLKMKEVQKDWKLNPLYDEYLKNLSENYKGSGNPMFGKTSSDKQKESVKQAHLDGKIKISEEGRKRITEGSKNRGKNSVKRSDIKTYNLISPDGIKYEVLGNQNLQIFCTQHKVEYHLIKKIFGIITSDMVNPNNKKTGKTTIGWQRI